MPVSRPRPKTFPLAGARSLAPATVEVHPRGLYGGLLALARVALLTWTLIGLGVLAVLLYLGYRINRAKATADLAIRLAEAYRSRGQFDVALRLYDVPGQLDQNKEAAQEGRAMAQAGRRRPPAIDVGLVEVGCQALGRDREHLEDLFARHGVEVELPPLTKASTDLSGQRS